MPTNKRKSKQGGGLLMSESMFHSISDDEVREKVLEEERRLAKIRQDAIRQAESEVIGKLPGGSGPPSWAISLLAKFLGRDDPTKDSSNQRKSNKGGGLLSPDREQYQVGGIASKLAKSLRGGKKTAPKEMATRLTNDELEIQQWIGSPKEIKRRINKYTEEEGLPPPTQEEIKSVMYNTAMQGQYRIAQQEAGMHETLPVELLLSDLASGEFGLDVFLKMRGKPREKTFPPQIQEFDDDLPLAKGGLLSSDRQQYAAGALASKFAKALVPKENPVEPPKIGGTAGTGGQSGASLTDGEDILMPSPSLEEETAMLPDEQMEDNYLNFVIDESLNPEEENHLMESLSADPRLSVIFDKLMNTATEFSGSGPVDGPGSEVSDSIPARLSDGEFVLTAKATDEIGPENIEAMMRDAEARSDERQLAQSGGLISANLSNEEKVDGLNRSTDDEIRKGMLGTNPRLQQLG